jgi:hypothetical protein
MVELGRITSSIICLRAIPRYMSTRASVYRPYLAAVLVRREAHQMFFSMPGEHRERSGIAFSCQSRIRFGVACYSPPESPSEVRHHVRRVLVALKFPVHWPSDVIQARRLLRILGITTSESIPFPFLSTLPSNYVYRLQCLRQRSKKLARSRALQRRRRSPKALLHTKATRRRRKRAVT